MEKNKQYYKYQSLGNDFILLDWLDEPQEICKELLSTDRFSHHVRSWCHRHEGIGADGVLIVTRSKHGDVDCFIFNADGSQAEICLNGLRSIAHFLFHQKNYPSQFLLLMSNRLMRCEVNEDEIQINIAPANYIDRQEIIIDNKKLIGHRVNVGNPHFIVLQEVMLAWLKKHGASIESHPLFPHRTNVEFIWEDQEMSKKSGMLTYQILVYERGCGITLACGSGAAAVMAVLYRLGKVKLNQNIVLSMLGGQMTSHLNDDLTIYQQAKASAVTTGMLTL